MQQKILEKFGQLSKDTWNQLAKEDAEYYILSDKEKSGKWDQASFLNKGKEQWLGFKKLLSHYGLDGAVAKEKTALDMGCGVGRMAFAMSSDFKEVFGVDVSEIMIEKAQEYQKIFGETNIKFSVNNGVDLSSFSDESLDFVFSYIVLQHCPSSKQVLKYIKEFSRVLKPGGVCLFQTRVSPTLMRFLKFNIQKKLRRIKYLGKKNNYIKEAVMGNRVYYPKLYSMLKKNFSAFDLVFSPIEIYGKDFWLLNSEFDRWKLANRANVDSIVINPRKKDNLPEGKKYNAIICLTVFEHLNNPLEVAGSFFEHLEPSGVLIFDYIKGEATCLDSQQSMKDRSNVLKFIENNFKILKGKIDFEKSMNLTVVKKL